MAIRGFSHTPAILQAASMLTLSILISKLRVWLDPAINLVTCFLIPYVVLISCFISLKSFYYTCHQQHGRYRHHSWGVGSQRSHLVGW